VGAGGPDLLAVENVVVAVADGLRLDSREVGAGGGLGVEGAPGVLEVGDLGDELVLLLLGAVEHEGGADPGDAHVEADGGGGVGHLLVVDDLLHDAGFHAAVVLRPGGREPAALGKLLVKRLRKLALDFDAEFRFAIEVVVPAGLELGLQELFDLGAEGFFFGGETKVHGWAPWVLGSRCEVRAVSRPVWHRFRESSSLR
jgi:hypothetical protein